MIGKNYLSARVVKIFIALVACFGLASCSNGHSYGDGTVGASNYKSVKRGSSAVVGRFMNWDKNCWARGVPSVTILKKPSKGTVSVYRGGMKIPHSVCRGIRIKGSQLTYRARSKGSDQFTYRVSSGPYKGVHTMHVNVK